MRWGQRRRTLSAEEKAANAAARAARESASLTCQICGRAILANTGVIAHHGYTRPVPYTQTSSCMGARELPFEASRDKLGWLIDQLATWIADQEKHVADIITEKTHITRFYTKPDAPRAFGFRIPTAVSFTRHDFDEVRERVPAAFQGRMHAKFDDFKADAVAEANKKRDDLVAERKICQKRFDAWKRKLTPVYIDKRFERWANVEKLK